MKLAPPSIIKSLRAQTQREHRMVERAFDLKYALSSRDSYRQSLQRLWGLHTAWESHAPQWIDERVLNLRNKSHWLTEDLRALGMSSPAIASIALCPLPEAMSTRSAAWGAMYVLEGSTLGGEIIYQQVIAKLSIDRHAGARFFFGYGPATRSMWLEFGALLTAQDALGRFSLDEAVGGARAMFACAEHWLKNLPAAADRVN